LSADFYAGLDRKVFERWGKFISNALMAEQAVYF
jgi:hypothetical protein